MRLLRSKDTAKGKRKRWWCWGWTNGDWWMPWDG